MRNSLRVLTAFCVFGLMAGSANAGESKAVQIIAGVLMHIQHIPSAADKEALAQVAADKDTTADEKTVAEALLHVQHMAAAADKPGLEAIVNDAKASGAVKTLAGIILSLHHFPSADDKTKLQALTQ